MEKIDIGIFEIADRRPSDFTLEGSEAMGMPVTLDCTSIHRIIPISTVVDKKTGRLSEIRFISGSHELDVKKQNEMGLKWNAVTDQIYIEGPRITIVGKDHHKSLLEYMRNCSYNKDAPNRPDGAPVIFFEVKKDEMTKRSIKTSQLEAKAISMCNRLVTMGPNDEPEYDKERIDFVARIFNITGAEDHGDKFIAILEIAKADPEYFLSTYANTTNEYRVAIRTAKELGVLGLDGPTAVLTASNAPIFRFNSKKVEAREEELIDFFLSEGEKEYQELVIETTAAKAKLAINP